jgi:hypothetical protein
VIEIAGKVLARAALLDSRIRDSDEIILAWARCFQGQKVWLEEALAAVDHHYQHANPFPLFPGDVIAYCAQCPVYSSADHARHFLEFWAQEPYSETIEAHTGIRPPEIAIPDYVPPSDERQFRVEHLTRWVAANRDQLVAAVMDRKFKAVTE